MIDSKKVQKISKKVHRIAALLIGVFLAFHFLNHLMAVHSPQFHVEFMKLARIIYLNLPFQLMLIVAVILQVLIGVFQFFTIDKSGWWAKLQAYSGLYLSFFMLFHLRAVLYYRYFESIDTNFFSELAVCL